MLRRTAPDAGDDALGLTDAGRAGLGELGLPIATPRGSRRPLCRPCLDWSERRSHLTGTLGAAILDHCLAAGWMARVPDSRAMSFGSAGEVRALAALDGRERSPAAGVARGAGTPRPPDASAWETR